MRPRHTDKTPAWIVNRFKKVDKQIRELAAARRLESATIGKGGLTIKDGGELSVRYPSGDEALRVGRADPAIYLPGYGLFFQDEDGNQIFTAFRLPPTTDFPDGITNIHVGAEMGASPNAVYDFTINSAQMIMLDCDDQIWLRTAGEMRLDGGAGGVQISHATTAASANCFIDPSDNRIWRSTSSLRYKQDVEDAEVDPGAVLKMRGRTWRDKAEVERDADTETRYVGFIAEELHDLGLGQFVVYDTDGDPEAISYDRLSVALLGVIKDQERRLTALESASDASEPADA